MITKRRTLEYYYAADGRCPFLNWQDNLRDVRGRAKIRVNLDRIGQGNLGGCKPVGDGVVEKTIDFGPGYRVYFALVKDRVVLLLCGGDKSTQQKDINAAQEYWIDYRRRKHGNT